MLRVETLTFSSFRRAVAEALHQLARLGTVLLDIGTIPGELFQPVLRHRPFAGRRRQHGAADGAGAFVEDGVERLAVQRQRHRFADVGVVERRRAAVDDQVDRDAGGLEFAQRLRRLGFHVLHQRRGNVGRKRQVEIAGGEGKDAGGAVLDDLDVDAVEIGPALLEVIRIADQADRIAALEFDEFERPGSDRAGAHHILRHVAGVDRRISGSEQQQERGLRRLQVKGDFIVAICRHVFEIEVPDLARVLAEVGGLALADQHVPGALHVLGGKRLAVMPFHAFVQFKCQFCVGRVPRPARREIGHHGFGSSAVRLRRIEHDQIIEDRHERRIDRDRRLLEDRSARRVVAVIEAQRAALFLRRGGAGGESEYKQSERSSSQASRHKNSSRRNCDA